MTKDELIRAWAAFPGDTALLLRGEQGQPVDIGSVNVGMVADLGGRRHYLMFQVEVEDDDDDD